MIVIRARVPKVPKRRSGLGKADRADFEAELLVLSANIVRSNILNRS